MTQFQTGNRTSTTATPKTGARGGTAQTGSGPNFVLILIAIGLGLLTVIVTNWYIHQIRTQVEAQKITLFQLKRAVEPGDQLQERDLIRVEVPAPEEVRKHYVDSLGALTPNLIGNYYGERFKRYANTNALVTSKLFTEEGRGVTGKVEIRDGYRGVPIEVDRNSGAPTGLLPEQVVDLMGKIDIPGQGEKARLIMERVRVLAVGGKTSSDAVGGRGYSEVMIELKPDEARAIKTIETRLPNNEFVLVTRNPTDDELEIPTGSINPELIRALKLELDPED